MWMREKSAGMRMPKDAVLSAVYAAIPFIPKAGQTGIFRLGFELKLPVHSPVLLHVKDLS
jgi:hypothetical protein